jgi:hypothetical protein
MGRQRPTFQLICKLPNISARQKMNAMHSNSNSDIQVSLEDSDAAVELNDAFYSTDGPIGMAILCNPPDANLEYVEPSQPQ